MTNSLDVLLKVAQSARDSASQAVTDADREIAALRERLDRTEETILAIRVDGDGAFAAGAFLAHLHRRQRSLRDSIRVSESVLQQAQARLLACYAEYKKLQLVKDYQAAEANLLERKREEAELDQIAMQVHFKDRAAG